MIKGSKLFNVMKAMIDLGGDNVSYRDIAKKIYGKSLDRDYLNDVQSALFTVRKNGWADRVAPGIYNITDEGLSSVEVALKGKYTTGFDWRR